MIYPGFIDQVRKKEICNYRINLYYTGPGTNYWKDFHDLRRHYPRIVYIFNILKNRGVEYYWFFFEPFIEITWLEHKNSGPKTLEVVESHAKNCGLKKITQEQLNSGDWNNKYSIAQSKDGITFCDWFDESYMEKFFGALRYSATSKVAIALYHTYDAVENGKGIHAQYMRSLHSLANQMGLNYKREGWYCLKRGIFCLMIWATKWFFPKRTRGGFRTACFIYEKIFRQKDIR